MTKRNLLGFHGLVFRSADPRRLAEKWRSLSGLGPLRKIRGGYVAGGPELFVLVRKGRAASPDALEEVHLAVKDVALTRRKRRFVVPQPRDLRSRRPPVPAAARPVMAAKAVAGLTM